MTDWGGGWSWILVVILEEFLNVIDCFIRSIQKICVMCGNVDEIIGSIVLNLLTGFLHLEVHCFRIKGDRSHSIGDGLMGVAEDSVKHYIRLYVHG